MSEDAGVRLRPAVPADVPALLPLLAAFAVDEEIGFQPEPTAAALLRLLADRSLGEVRLVEEDGRPLGYGLITYGFDLEHLGRDAYVTELFVVEQARGRGLGRRLLAALLEAGSRAGSGAVHLAVRPENAIARALYRAAGFAPAPRELWTRLETGVVSPGARPGGPSPWYLDRERRAGLLALLDTSFPDLSARIAAAGASGWPWEQVTEPFVVEDASGPAAHVGVIAHAARAGGVDLEIAGLHAVCTRPDARRRGLARRALAAALEWADQRFTCAKLHTDLPEVYTPHGFRPLPLHRFRVERAGGRGGARPLDPRTELAWLGALLASRTPVSDRFASRDPGWLAGIDLHLGRRDPGALQVVEPLGLVVDWRVDEQGILHLHDLFARRLPTLGTLCDFAPRHRAVELYFCPDRLAPEALAVPFPEAGILMVRGDWPVPDGEPLGVSPLAEH